MAVKWRNKTFATRRLRWQAATSLAATEIFETRMGTTLL
jgi:hypothetical protein